MSPFGAAADPRHDCQHRWAHPLVSWCDVTVTGWGCAAARGRCGFVGRNPAHRARRRALAATRRRAHLAGSSDAGRHPRRSGPAAAPGFEPGAYPRVGRAPRRPLVELLPLAARDHRCHRSRRSLSRTGARIGDGTARSGRATGAPGVCGAGACARRRARRSPSRGRDEWPGHRRRHCERCDARRPHARRQAGCRAAGRPRRGGGGADRGGSGDEPVRRPGGR